MQDAKNVSFYQPGVTQPRRSVRWVWGYEGEAVGARC